MHEEDRWFEDRLLERFLTYARIDTASNKDSKERPTSQGQWTLARLLLKELIDLGVRDAILDDKCFLVAALPSNQQDIDVQTVGFMAHMDTSEDVRGAGVKPQVHRDYDGRPIQLGHDVVLDPEENPDLQRYIGGTIITSDGTTLLGADDKAGIAEIMTAVEYLLSHPSIAHGKIEIILTPDEETGFGMDGFPLDRIESSTCYTLDGGGEGIIEAECFEAYKLKLTLEGKPMHPGTARGKLINAVEMAGSLLGLLPREESPQTTDGRLGYYYPLEVEGNAESVSLLIYVRDFDPEQCRRRVETIRSMAATVQSIYPGSAITVQETKQYSNMKLFLDEHPDVIANLAQAISETGVTPRHSIVRGGTDGARLSEMGVPTPNIFTGGYNYHSRLEWAALSSMAKASRTLVNLAHVWVVAAAHRG